MDWHRLSRDGTPEESHDEDKDKGNDRDGRSQQEKMRTAKTERTGK